MFLSLYIINELMEQKAVKMLFQAIAWKNGNIPFFLEYKNCNHTSQNAVRMWVFHESL